jgi:hypothetical protein
VRQEKGDSSMLKLRYDSNANNNKEEQQEKAIFYTNTLLFTAWEHALSLI